MSDFLSNLVARSLGTAESVRPRLAGRFEPPPDALAPEAPRRASAWDEFDVEPLELSIEVETRPAPTRDSAPTRVGLEASHVSASRPETTDPPERVVFVREPRDESQSPSSHERSPARPSVRTHDAPPRGRESERHEAPSPSPAAESRTQTRAGEESDAQVRPKSITPSFDEETARAAAERERAARRRVEADDDEAEPVKPASTTHRPARSVTGARTRDERSTPSPLETLESQGHDDAQRPAAQVRPSPTSLPPRREDEGAARARVEASSLKRTESADAREPARARQSTEADSPAARHARREERTQASIEPQHARRVKRQAAARDAARSNATPAPTINVTIGRVEVRATQSAPATPRRTDGAAPLLSLDDYLRRRSGEVRE